MAYAVVLQCVESSTSWPLDLRSEAPRLFCDWKLPNLELHHIEFHLLTMLESNPEFFYWNKLTRVMATSLSLVILHKHKHNVLIMDTLGFYTPTLSCLKLNTPSQVWNAMLLTLSWPHRVPQYHATLSACLPPPSSLTDSPTKKHLPLWSGNASLALVLQLFSSTCSWKGACLSFSWRIPWPRGFLLDSAGTFPHFRIIRFQKNILTSFDRKLIKGKLMFYAGGVPP